MKQDREVLKKLSGKTLAFSQADTTGEERSQPSPPARSIFSAELAAIKLLEEPREEEIEKRWVFLGRKRRRYLLVLDLDDTLVSTTETSTQSSLGCTSQCEIRVRPHAVDVLKKLSDLYELVIFTAGDEAYAQKAARLLDPEGGHILRVLGRSHCLPLGKNIWVKDLRIFADRDLRDILIADNNVLSFSFQLAHGIPIVAYDPANLVDEELLNLLLYLDGLSHEEDIIKANSEAIGLAG